jgi:hypothetical protein
VVLRGVEQGHNRRAECKRPIHDECLVWSVRFIDLMVMFPERSYSVNCDKI